jgi:hypothetical protein
MSTSTALSAEHLEKLRETIARSEAWEKEQRLAIYKAHWSMTVATISDHGSDALRVTLRGLSAEGQISVVVPRQSLYGSMLEPGATWNLYPGHREPNYREKLLAARKALLAAGGDVDRLSDDERETLADGSDF